MLSKVKYASHFRAQSLGVGTVCPRPASPRALRMIHGNATGVDKARRCKGGGGGGGYGSRYGPTPRRAVPQFQSQRSSSGRCGRNALAPPHRQGHAPPGTDSPQSRTSVFPSVPRHAAVWLKSARQAGCLRLPRVSTGRCPTERHQQAAPPVQTRRRGPRFGPGPLCRNLNAHRRPDRRPQRRSRTPRPRRATLPGEAKHFITIIRKAEPTRQTRLAGPAEAPAQPARMA